MRTRLLGSAICAMLTVGWAAPARADWETVSNIDRPEDRNCSVPHDRRPALKKSESRALRLPAGWSQEIEVYGHFIDDPTFIAQLFGPGTAGRVRGVGGAVNGARGCGNIGSVVVKVSIPPDAAAGSSELRIGRGGDDWHARIPIQIKPLRLASTAWAPQTLQGRSTLQPGPPPPANAPAAPPRSSQPGSINNGATGCFPNGTGCNGGSGLVILKGSVGGSTISTPDLPDAIGGCLDNISGRASISGNVLTLSLPRNHAQAANMACLRRPVIVEFETEFDRPLDTSGAYAAGSPRAESRAQLVSPPAYAAPAGMRGPFEVNREPLFRTFQFDEAFLTNLTASQQLTLRAVGGGAPANDLVIQLNVPN